MPATYPVQCFNCLSDYDAAEAIWCSCNPQRPTKVCPFCLGCFCAAGQEFKDGFWRDAPKTLRDEIATLSQSRMLIGEMLVRAGVITTTQLLEALNRQKTEGKKLGEILIESGALPPDRLDSFLMTQHAVATVDLTRARVDAVTLRRLGVDQCLREKILPLEAEAFRDRHIMTLAMGDPSDAAALNRVMKTTGYQVIPGVAPADAIVAVIRSIFPQGSATPGGAPPPPSQTGGAIKLLGAASRRRASHIHIHKTQGVSRIHYRIDGVLYLDRARPSREGAALLAALRDMAGLEGEPHLVPRVGRALVDLDGLEQAIIVRTRPGREGEEMTVKLLDPVSFPPRLDDLGFRPATLDTFRTMLDRESGLLVLSAPPVSGASSTVYALAMEVAAQGRPLAIVESPRAVSLTDVSQEEFFPEIRNSQRDAIARAAASSPRVLAMTATGGMSWGGETANLPERMVVIVRMEALSLPDTLRRLVADGYPAPALKSRPTLVVHQRLVRRPCGACRAVVSDASEHAAALGIPVAEARKVRIWRGAGCDDCAQTSGYRGRTPLVQTLRVTPGVVGALSGGSPGGLLAACRSAGMTSLRSEAVAALSDGLTTPEEIIKKKLG